jgi:hypothetical protein
MGYLFEDCEFIGGNTGINVVQDGGSGSFCGSGITAKGCTFAWISIGAFTCQSTTYTLTSPYVVRGCVFAQCNVGISSTDDSLVDEDYNKFACSTARTNTTAGANSTDGERISLSFNLERLYGGSPRPFLEPTEGSTLIGAAGYDSPTTTDLYNQARPDPPSIGAIERDTFDGGGDTIITNIFQVEA